MTGTEKIRDALIDELTRGRWMDRPAREVADAILALPEMVAAQRSVEALRRLVQLKNGPRDFIYQNAKPGAWQDAAAAVDAYDTAVKG